MKAVIERWYSRLPLFERDQPLVILNGAAYTPNQVLAEVRANTALGRMLQAEVERGSFGDTEVALAKLRLKMILEKATVSVVPLQTGRTYTPLEIWREIETETPIGKQWIKVQVQRIRQLRKI